MTTGLPAAPTATPSRLEALVRRDVSLAPLTTLKVGGAADWYAEPESLEEMRLCLGRFRDRGLAVAVLGAGSNLLVDDAGFRGAVVCTRRLDRLVPSGEHLVAEAGVGLGRLIAAGLAHGLAGLEVLAGIPGTVGGAAVMNAGTRSGAMGPMVEEVVALEGDRVVTLCGDALGYAYRTSALGTRVVMEVVLRVPRGDVGAARRRMVTYLQERVRTQPVELPSAGCVFTNPPGHSAGRLIDEAGCKGLRRGGAQVSPRHANFIVNRGGATAAEVRWLIQEVRARVATLHGIRLDLELRTLAATSAGRCASAERAGDPPAEGHRSRSGPRDSLPGAGERHGLRVASPTPGGPGHAP
ncbi:MAG: UDP-N-acetylmuramate dehydrogenase [Planctomycetes bacterium]|nr:UDP-N-acetylmuramate dehydrogenase [Planctomycetota bacterium]